MVGGVLEGEVSSVKSGCGLAQSDEVAVEVEDRTRVGELALDAKFGVIFVEREPGGCLGEARVLARVPGHRGATPVAGGDAVVVANRPGVLDSLARERGDFGEAEFVPVVDEGGPADGEEEEGEKLGPMRGGDAGDFELADAADLVVRREGVGGPLAGGNPFP